jgi:hypothetical protein
MSERPLEERRAGILRAVESSYLEAFDRGTSGPAEPRAVLAGLWLALEDLCELEREYGRGELYVTVAKIDELGPGRLKLFASQAVTELAELRFRAPSAEDEEEE